MKFDTSCLKLKQLIESFTPDEKIKKRQRRERGGGGEIINHILSYQY